MENHIEVIYPEIGYFELGNVIDNLNIRKNPTKGSRMSCICLSKNVYKKSFLPFGIHAPACLMLISKHMNNLFISVNK